MTNSFDVWAPEAKRVQLVTGDGEQVDLNRGDLGWWWLTNDDAGRICAEAGPDGVDYGYLLDDDPTPYPDPRSRYQPHGVHGLSRSYDPNDFIWPDTNWTGRELAGGVIYELHIGTFTPEGTLDAAIGKLDHLVDLGIDFVELMPVNAFNGEHGWGYDGVGWYAVHHTYGGPAAYQRFVAACHAKGLGVIQDVVYNHLGPSGNYLPKFGPYLDEGMSSPWGLGINLSRPGSDVVRRYILDNALMWCRDYGVDGLRLDAVHALIDDRAVHLLEEMADEVQALSTYLRRPLSLIAESDLNDPRLISSREAGGYGLTAQWSDDFHHALVANLTGDASGYYADFDTLEALAKVVEQGFFHDGTRSSFRGRRHGRRLDTRNVPASRLVVCSDNHDQIGNRADGARLDRRLTTRQLQLAAALTLLNASTPMIFMGQEWSASTPWAFFTSHPQQELGEAVTAGRIREFEAMNWDHDAILDPQDPDTFTASILPWHEVDQGEHAEVLRTYRELIGLRRDYPDLVDPRFDWIEARYRSGESWFVMERGRDMAVVCNFGVEPVTVDLDGPSVAVYAIGEVDDSAGSSVTLGTHSVAVMNHRFEKPLPPPRRDEEER